MAVGPLVLTIAMASAMLLSIPGLVWIVRAAKKRAPGTLKRRVGSYAVMYSLFFSFGKMFEPTPDYVETTRDPERLKRAENGDPPPTE